MKRVYGKPTIHVEVMAVDMPIASSCNSTGDAFELRLQGWFVNTQNCLSDGDDWNMPGEGGDYGDTICYHSNIITAQQS